MSLQVTILGSGGTIPTVERHLPAIVVKRMGNVFLFDCGEGTQRQFMKAKIGFGGLRCIFISHFHADHVLGLPGLLMTMNLMGIEQEIRIFGPKGVEAFVSTALSLVPTQLRFPVEPVVIAPGVVFQGDDYRIEAFHTRHSIRNFGFALIEDKRFGRVDIEKVHGLGIPVGPLVGQLQRGDTITLEDGRTIHPGDVVGPSRSGRKVVIAIDTRPCSSVKKMAEDADLLIYDGMFLDDLKDEAVKRGHSTLGDGVKVAQQAKVKQLVFTHVSPRYLGKHNIVQKAASVLLEDAIVARDLQRFELTYTD